MLDTVMPVIKINAGLISNCFKNLRERERELNGNGIRPCKLAL
jgi:hypothetical protein